MKALINRIRSHSTIRYLFIGGTVYLLELLIIVVAEKNGLHSLIAVTLSFWIGLSASFLFHKLITFQDKRFHHRIVIPQLIAYCLLVAFNFGFTLLCISLLDSIFPTWISRAIALGITVIWNFYLYKTRIFKQPSLHETKQ